MDQKLRLVGQDSLLLSARQTKPELRDLPRQEPDLMLTAHWLLVQEPKVSEALKGQLDQQELLALQVQLAQQGLLVLKVQQAQMVLTVLTVQQEHKGHKALLALRVRRAIQA